MANYWELFAHEADVGVRGFGDTLADAFAQAAMALTSVITDNTDIAPRTLVTIECENPDQELLLVDWLNALVYEIATRNMLFSRFQVTISGARLQAKIWGESINIEKHQPAVEVKGATYTCLDVTQQSDGQWVVQTVIDV